MTEAARQEIMPADKWDDRPAPAVSESSALISMIERASRDPAVDIDKFERLMKMHREAQERRDLELAAQAKQAFNAAMAEVQKKLPQVVRNAENKQTNSVYATLDAIGDAIDPIISEAGFMQSFGFGECTKENHYRIVCRTSFGAHESVDFIDMPIDNAGPKGEVNKTKPHALSSTAMYGRRLLTCMVWNVKTRKALPDDDGNAAGGSVSEPVSKEQFEALVAAAEVVNANEAKFLKHFGIKAVADLPAARFTEAMNVLRQIKSPAK